MDSTTLATMLAKAPERCLPALQVMRRPVGASAHPGRSRPKDGRTMTPMSLLIRISHAQVHSFKNHSTIMTSQQMRPRRRCRRPTHRPRCRDARARTAKAAQRCNGTPPGRRTADARTTAMAGCCRRTCPRGALVTTPKDVHDTGLSRPRPRPINDHIQIQLHTHTSL